MSASRRPVTLVDVLPRSHAHHALGSSRLTSAHLGSSRLISAHLGSPRLTSAHASRRWAPITRCKDAAVGLDAVLNLRGFELDRVLEMDPDFLDGDGEHMHDDRVTSVGLHQPGALGLALPRDASSGHGGSATSSRRVGLPYLAGELDMEKTNAWIAKLLQLKGTDIFRMKARARLLPCATTCYRPLPPATACYRLLPRATTCSRVLPRAPAPYAAIRRGGAVAQGVLAMAGVPHKFVYQGVHMQFKGEFTEEWGKDEARTNRIVFIGAAACSPRHAVHVPAGLLRACHLCAAPWMPCACACHVHMCMSSLCGAMDAMCMCMPCAHVHAISVWRHGCHVHVHAMCTCACHLRAAPWMLTWSATPPICAPVCEQVAISTGR